MDVNSEKVRGSIKQEYWGVNNCVQRVLRCDLGAIYDLMDYWLEEKKEAKMEKCIEGLVEMKYPKAYTIAAVKYDKIARDYEGSFKVDESVVYYKKACQMLKLAYENGEKDIDYYYAMYEMTRGDREAACEVLEKIASNKKHKNCKAAKKSLKREKKRNSPFGKLSVYAYDFDETRLIHIIYLLIMLLMIFKIEGCFGLGIFLFIIYVILKVKSGKVSKPKGNFEYLQNENLATDPLYQNGKIETPMEVGNPWLFTEHVEDIEEETMKIRANKKKVILERASKGDEVAEAALKCFFGIYRQGDEFVDGEEAIFGITEEYLQKKYKAVGLRV